MARPLRIEFPGALYHLTSRGNARSDIFDDDLDRQKFLVILSSVVYKHRWICHGYCLMGNHYHLLIETPEGNLCRGMRQLNGVYTQAFNRRHGRVGHLLQGRYKSILVEKESYLLELCRYIVLNPVKAEMVNAPEDWAWSSYRATAGLTTAPEFLNTSWVLGQFADHIPMARERYIVFVRDGLDCQSPWADLRGGLLLGDEGFVARMKPNLSEKMFADEIPRRERLAHRPDLEELFSGQEGKEQRSKAAYQAHVEWGYTLKDIGEVLGVHYATVSRMVRREEEMWRCKT